MDRLYEWTMLTLCIAYDIAHDVLAHIRRGWELGTLVARSPR